MLFNNKTYDLLKWAVVIFLPALSVLLASLGDLYQWHNTPLYVQTLNIFTAFLGSLLQISSYHYQKGDSEE